MDGDAVMEQQEVTANRCWWMGGGGLDEGMGGFEARK